MRSWMIIPAMGIAAAIGVGLLGGGMEAALAMGVAGAALVAAMRMLVGDGPAAYVGAAVAALLFGALAAEVGVASLRAGIAVAAMAWTIAELARPAGRVPAIVALGPAIIAACADPSFVGLVAIAGTRAVTGRTREQKWVVALPILGGLMLVAAVIAGTATRGTMATLGTHWFAHARHAHGGAAAVFARVGEAVGPLAAVAALAGLASLVRVRLAELAVAVCIVGALLVDLRAGATGAAALGMAALASGLAVTRFASPIRIAPAQAFVAATAGLLLVIPPVWSAAARPHVAVASRSR